MKRLLHTWGEKIRERANEEEEAQRQRECRLQELEQKRGKTGFQLLHPLQEMREQREIKVLRKQIEEYKSKKKDQRMLLYSAGVLLTIFVIIGGATIVKPYNIPAQSATEMGSSFAQEVANSASKEQEDISLSSQTQDDSISEVEKNEQTECFLPETTSEIGANSLPEGMSLLTVSDLDVFTQTEYAHISNGENSVVLGQDEHVTIKVETAIPGLAEDEIVVLYDETLLQVSANNLTESEEGTCFTFDITGKKAGIAEIIIATAHDIWCYGEEAEGYVITIYKLDASDGQIVYTTPTGEKYHLSTNCAGSNGIKRTKWDAVQLGYEPCKKCA